MKKYFFTHLIEYESIFIEFEKLEFSEDEKKHLAHLIDENLHHKVLDAVLSELNEEDKKTFLLHLHKDEHEKIWELLNKRVDNIEDKIKKAAEELKAEIHKDLKEAHKLKEKKII